MGNSITNSNGRSTRAEVNRCRGGCVEVGVNATIAQVSLSVRSPTLQVAIVEDGAGNHDRQTNDSNGRSARAEVNRCGGRCVEVRGGSTIAQLSIVVPSPALQVAVVKDGAGMGI